MLRRMGPFVLGAMLALVVSAAAEEQAPGVTATKIKLGNTAPYSGPASSYGTIARSALAYFEMVNDKGGIHGRKVEVISLDDSFSPPKAVEQTRKLVEGEEVFAIFMPLGSPTSAATQSYLNGKKVPQIFVTSGADRWNQPEKYPWSIGWNLQYAAEGRIYAKYILDNVKDPRIAVLYQNDEFGKAVLSGLKEGLGDRVSAIADVVSYELTDTTVDLQVAKLKNSGATVFVSLTTPKFAAQSIRAVDNLAWKPLFILPSVSNSIDPVLNGAGLERSVGVISASYAKQPSDPQWRELARFQGLVRIHGQVLPVRIQNRLAQCLRLWNGLRHASGAGNGRPEADARDADERASQHPEHGSAHASARNHDQHLQDRPRADQVDADVAFQR